MDPFSLMYGRNLASAAGAAQGLRSGLPLMLSAWQGQTVRGKGRKMQDAETAAGIAEEERRQHNAFEIMGLKRTEALADDERDFAQAQEMARLQHDLRGELQDERLAGMETRLGKSLEARHADLMTRLAQPKPKSVAEQKYEEQLLLEAGEKAARRLPIFRSLPAGSRPAFSDKGKAEEKGFRAEGRANKAGARADAAGARADEAAVRATHADERAAAAVVTAAENKKAADDAKAAAAAEAKRRADINARIDALKEQANKLFRAERDPDKRAKIAADFNAKVAEEVKALTGRDPPTLEMPPEEEKAWWQYILSGAPASAAGMGGSGGSGALPAAAGAGLGAILGRSVAPVTQQGGLDVAQMERVAALQEDAKRRQAAKAAADPLAAGQAAWTAAGTPFASMEGGPTRAGAPSSGGEAFAESEGRRVTQQNLAAKQHVNAAAVASLKSKTPEARAAAIAEMRADPATFESMGVDVAAVLAAVGQ